MYTQQLTDVGLSREQAEVYEILLKSGPLTARKIATQTTIKRGLIYKTLERLEEVGVVERKDAKDMVSVFHPKHPLALQRVVETQKKDADNALLALEGVMGRLSGDFNLSVGRPGVRFYEGEEGLKTIYEDILKTGKDFYIVRAPYETTYRKVVPFIAQFVKRRVRKGMFAIALTPRDEAAAEPDREEKDRWALFTRTWVDPKEYTAPVEIDVYGNKVAFLSFGKELVGTIVESPQIAGAMKELLALARKGATQKESKPSATQLV